MKVRNYLKEENITLEQYLYVKTGSMSIGTMKRAITKKEAKVFRISLNQENWFERYAKRQYSINIAQNAARLCISQDSRKSKAKDRLVHAFFNGKYPISMNTQYVYLMVNENNHSKIGISNNPMKRMKGIKYGSGYDIKSIHWWDVEDSPNKIERHLHLSFGSDRKIGEWFDIKISPEEIENYILCNHTRIY
jgi:hypothetical protein